MKVSIIVPTYNRSGQIINLLRALEAQTHKGFEVVVVNDGSTDDSLRNINEFVCSSALDIAVYTIRNRGRAGSRNYGVEKCSGDLVIFLDDDMRPNAEAVSHHVSAQRSYSKALISGPCLYDPSKFVNDFNYFRQWMESQWVSASEEIVASENLRINGGNFSIRRRDFLALGGFDERLRDKEDFKLSFDFSHKGNGEILCCYGAWAYHDDFKGLLDYVDRARMSRLEEQKLRLIEPQIERLFPERFQIDLPKGVKYQLARVFRSRSVIRFWEVVLNTRVILRALRFKLYDIIITMNVRYCR